MERDFLGINANKEMESSSSRNNARRAPTPNPATHGNAALQWQFSNMGHPQYFQSFATQQEGQSSKFSQSAFQPVPTPQMVLSLAAKQFHQSEATHQVSETRAPCVKQRPSGSAATSMSPRNDPFIGTYSTRREFPTNLPSQLTMFYKGSVSVFDNVPVDKCEEIMSLAKKASSTPCHCSQNPKLKQPIKKSRSKPASSSGGIVIGSKQKPTEKLDYVADPVLLPPFVTTHVSPKAKGPAGSSSMNAVTNHIVPMMPPPYAPVTKAVMASTAASNVSQARSASVARFLEKRKERVKDSMPYPTTAKSAEVLPSKSSSTNLTLSINGDEKAPAGQCFKNSGEENPCTRLEI